MKKNFLITAFIMATLSLSAQTNNDEITLSPSDFGFASVSTDIHSLGMVER